MVGLSVTCVHPHDAADAVVQSAPGALLSFPEGQCSARDAIVWLTPDFFLWFAAAFKQSLTPYSAVVGKGPAIEAVAQLGIPIIRREISPPDEVDNTLELDHIALVLPDCRDAALPLAGCHVDHTRSHWRFSGLGTETLMISDGDCSIEVNWPKEEGYFSSIVKRYGRCVVGPVFRSADVNKARPSSRLRGSHQGGPLLALGEIERIDIDAGHPIPLFLWRGQWPEVLGDSRGE